MAWAGTGARAGQNRTGQGRAGQLQVQGQGQVQDQVQGREAWDNAKVNALDNTELS